MPVKTQTDGFSPACQHANREVVNGRDLLITKTRVRNHQPPAKLVIFFAITGQFWIVF